MRDERAKCDTHARSVDATSATAPITGTLRSFLEVGKKMADAELSTVDGGILVPLHHVKRRGEEDVAPPKFDSLRRFTQGVLVAREIDPAKVPERIRSAERVSGVLTIFANRKYGRLLRDIRQRDHVSILTGEAKQLSDFIKYIDGGGKPTTSF